ncbi:MAG: tetratricopeptide repeat protein [Candidatus Sumerlaeaceae bacterium]
MKYNPQQQKVQEIAIVGPRQGVILLVAYLVPAQFGMLSLVMMVASSGSAQGLPATDAAQTTSVSPLSILQAAPKVHIEDPPQFAPAPVPEKARVQSREQETPKAEKKPGLVKGMIRAIPFLGPRIAGPKVTPTPVPPSTHDLRMEEDVEPSSPPASSTRLRLDPEPESQRSQFAPSTEDNAAVLAPGAQGGIPAVPAVPSDAQTLSVKSAVANTDETSASAPEPPLKAAGFAGVNVDVVTTATTAEAPQSSPTLEAADLGMPNPAYEQNEVIRSEYIEAVKAGRSGNFPQAAQLFRDYAANHPSSGLTPRALFLAALLEPLPEKSEESEKILRERFPTSRFLSELEKRNRARAKAMATPTPITAESPARAAGRLESELTEAVGSPDREVPLRLRLGQAYLTLEEYERALEVLRPAVDASRGRFEEADILILISECYIATHRNAQAVTLLADVLQRFPAAPQRPRALYDYGLVNEASGNFERARTMYSELRQKWPASAEAAQAVQRLRDMDRLAE